MNRDRFIRQRRDDWQQLESVLARLRDLRSGRWLGTDIEMLARLYRSVCCDLSLVQSREWGRRLEVYLNDLVAQGHGCLYRSPPGSLRTLLEFVAYDFPRLLRGHWKCLVAALMLFAIPLITAGVVAAIDPVRVKRAKVARWTLLANRVGYLFVALAMALFFMAFAFGFNSTMATLVIVSFLIGCALLTPSIILGYAVKAAERDDRERGL